MINILFLTKLLFNNDFTFAFRMLSMEKGMIFKMKKLQLKIKQGDIHFDF